jgi:hypothetical protein
MKRNSRLLIVPFLTLFPLFLHAENAASARLVMVPAGDPLYENLRALSVETGVAVPSFSLPLASYEIQNYLDSLTPESFSPASRALYDAIERELSPHVLLGEDDSLALGAEAGLNAEASAKTNNALPWVLPDEHHSAPFLFVAADLFAYNRLQLHVSAGLCQPFTDADVFNKYGRTNIIYKSVNTGINNINARSFLAFGGRWWNAEIGRDRLSFGLGHRGNLLVSDTPMYQDFVRFSVFSAKVKYSCTVSQIPLRVDQSMVDPCVVNLADYPDILTEDNERYEYIHRLDFQPIPALSIGVSELLIVTDPLKLEYFNPLGFMHNYFAGNKWLPDRDDSLTGNSLFGLDVQWALARGVNLYAQWACDELATGKEDTRQPNAMAFLLGLDVHALFIEAAYVFPYMYMDNSPFAASLWQNNQKTASTDWLAYPDGRDLVSVEVGGRFAPLDTLTLESTLLYMARGAHTLLFDTYNSDETASEIAPSGMVEHQISLSTKARWNVLNHITIHGGVAFTLMLNNRHSEGSTALGAEMSVGAALRT